ncbi:MAG: hypothetical protein M0R47_15780 [Methylobacter sp.]|uniref:hypothetical protein n=1 Tax=Methylobacter sp. TaxID=2051955 RepID=UPI0025D31ACB|nr:hypothetical protein [Methylobacter sp.]MCK9621980.1 hypothetical protein [Methylobacter sp.]
MKAKELLMKLGACIDAINWVGDRTIEDAWNECHRGDWMLWFYAKQYPENKRELYLAKGHCANTVRHLMTDERSIAAVDAAIAYGNGEIDEIELYNAARRSAAYAYLYPYSYATDAAYAAYAAAYSAYAAYAAKAAADAAAAYASARKDNQKQTADICRKHLILW